MQKIIMFTNEEVESIKLELDTMIEFAGQGTSGKEDSEDVCEWLAKRLKRIKSQFE